ncbi:salivary glue protein Sgs-3-like [Sabethes cyaneus]|uniref:salivary glue protein Sgs-3-like n=1 Tax=Sabethes cyaneus TaxID=53552 RepID=UPI00237D5AA3|nr:salivary glue protein Sgs-3-like [Sabethes cyaneus]
MKLWIGLFLLGLAIEGQAQLTCFVCNDCPDPFDTSAAQVACPTTDTTTTTSFPPTVITPPGEQTTLAPGVTTTTVAAPPTDGPILTPPPIGRRKRQTQTHQCFVRELPNLSIQRGCTVFDTDETTTCRNLNSGINPVGYCRVCNWAGCNSASGVTLSIVTLLTALLIALKLL